MAATKPTRLYLSGDHPGKYQPSYLSNGDGASEDMYQPNAAASATYMKFLHLVDTQLSDDERSVSPPPPPPPSSSSTHQTTSTDNNAQTSGDNYYRPLSPPAYDAVSPEGGDTPVYQDPVERARQEKEWQEELVKVEGEILTLRQVLTAKVRQATELKRKLGITPMQEFKQDIQAGFQQLRDSGTSDGEWNRWMHDDKDEGLEKAGTASAVLNSATTTDLYQKTSTVMKSASEKTASALSTIGASVSKRFGDLRNSQTFKNVEEKVETAYANVKTSKSIENLKDKLGATGYFLGTGNSPTEARVKGSKSDNSIDEAFQQAASAPTTPRSEENPPLPEEKVPL